MTTFRRLTAAVTGALLVSGVFAAPAMAAPGSGPLTFTPKSGQHQFGDGNPTDRFTITPATADCPTGSEMYVDVLSPQGSEDGWLTAGTPITASGIIIRDPSAGPILTVPAHEAHFQNNVVQDMVGQILPAGTTDERLSPADAAKPVGTVIAEGQFSVFSVCLNGSAVETARSDIHTVTFRAATRAPKPANWPAEQFYDVLQWSYAFDSDGTDQPEATTVTLTASPGGSAQAGAAVSLTATVTPSAATGSVRFLDGSTEIGTKAVTAGQASLTTSDLQTGAHSLSAVFTPDDATKYLASTGTLSYQIVPSNPNAQKGEVTVRTTVPSSPGGGDLTMTVDQSAVTLPQAVREGDSFVTGQVGVNLVTVTDNRTGTLPGWNVSGTVADRFAGANAANSFDGTALGWTPLIVSQAAGQGVTAGPAVESGTDPGLTSPGSTLALAPAGSGAGTAKLGADLALQFPATTPADTYSAVITITLI
ncbi:hypothetical protein J2S43_005752 [Catenuloplanes nepalensis]|uniref:Bacterial Ig-like domain-containing protein n=1 Tax=Catenuloplanes nepalensis TaxID=587533 RepID=A0ABT9N0M3_9ACTN|nr:Ig-like domain-containing protein [Catenuloplanes nepalensis]MDP9797240.1 hypothetical protein [Catenuloplanes nepalensis]